MGHGLRFYNDAYTITYIHLYIYTYIHTDVEKKGCGNKKKRRLKKKMEIGKPQKEKKKLEQSVWFFDHHQSNIKIAADLCI